MEVLFIYFQYLNPSTLKITSSNLIICLTKLIKKDYIYIFHFGQTASFSFYLTISEMKT